MFTRDNPGLKPRRIFPTPPKLPTPLNLSNTAHLLNPAQNSHSERSRPIFSSSFAPAKESVCEVEESLFDPSRRQVIPSHSHSTPPQSFAPAPRAFSFRISSNLCRSRASNP